MPDEDRVTQKEQRLTEARRFPSREVQKIQESAQFAKFEKDPLKHYVRKVGWLEPVKQYVQQMRDAGLDRTIKYLTLPGEQAIDIGVMWKAGFIRRQGGKWSCVAICDRNHAATVVNNLGEFAAASSLWLHEELRRSNSLLAQFFPIDVVNLDFWGTFIKDAQSEQTILQNVNTVRQIVHLQRGQGFLLLLTHKISETSYTPTVRDGFVPLLEDNLKDERFKKPCQDVFGGEEPALSMKNILQFGMLAVSKIIAKLASEFGYQVEELFVGWYPRPEEDYQMAAHSLLFCPIGHRELAKNYFPRYSRRRLLEPAPSNLPDPIQSIARENYWGFVSQLPTRKIIDVKTILAENHNLEVHCGKKLKQCKTGGGIFMMNKIKTISTQLILDRLTVADARHLPNLFNLNTPLVDTIITSPPYGGLIDYRVNGQLGHGQTWEAYLDDLMEVFRSCYSLLKDTGSLWVVVDAWREGEKYRLLPLEIANRSTTLGWKLQDIIIWDKQHTLPYYRRGQFQPVYEYIMFFTKTNTFKFYRDRIREVDGLSMWWVDFPERFNPQGKSPTNIWQFPIRPQGAWRGKRENWRHDCPFPTELVARIIELTTDEGDVVFDPFAGSGVVLATAAAMRRHYLGLEINRQFVSQFNIIVKSEIAKEWNILASKRHVMNSLNGSFTSLILRLRALKYARKVTSAISAQIQKLNRNASSDKLELKLCVCLANIPDIFVPGDTMNVSLLYLFSGPKERFEQVIEKVDKLLKMFPLSHYRINPSIKGYSRKTDLRKPLTKYPKLYLYPRIKPRSFESLQSTEEWLGDDARLSKSNVIPLLSNLEVDVSWIADSYGPPVIQG